MERIRKLEMKVAELKRDARSLMKIVQPVQLRALTDYFLAQHRSSADEDKSGAPWNSYIVRYLHIHLWFCSEANDYVEIP
jgi:hypothetical protein